MVLLLVVLYGFHQLLVVFLLLEVVWFTISKGSTDGTILQFSEDGEQGTKDLHGQGFLHKMGNLRYPFRVASFYQLR